MPNAAKEPVIEMATHNRSGALFSTIPAIRSEIQAIDRLFKSSGGLGIRLSKVIVDAMGSAINHLPRGHRLTPVYRATALEFTEDILKNSSEIQTVRGGCTVETFIRRDDGFQNMELKFHSAGIQGAGFGHLAE